MNNDYKELRQLLAQWYDGADSPRIEERIARLFAEIPALPDDLESDRKLFTALCEAREDAVAETIPSLLDSRIRKAVNDSMSATDATAVHRFPRMLMYVAAACVACLIMTLAVVRFGIGEKSMPGTPRDVSADHIPVVAAMSVSSEDSCSVAEKSRAEAVSQPCPSRYTAKASRRRRVTVADSQTSVSDEEHSLPEGYRVVTNEAEANAIVCSVIMNLECRMVQQSVKIDDIKNGYEARLASL